MAILCGTDFSPHAAAAADAAAALAIRCSEPLELAHVAVAGEPPEPARAALAAEAERLRALGAEVRAETLTGPPEAALTAHAERTDARLIVVASLGQRPGGEWTLGSSAERLVVVSKVPVLVVRDAVRLVDWARKSRRLRAMVGVDFSTTSDAAVRWLAGLRALHACDAILTHVCWSPGEHRRLRIEGPLDLEQPHPEVERALGRDLGARFLPLGGEGEARLQIRSGLGRPADHLLQIATEEGVDLLIVGTHQRTGLSKLWHGSVSHDILRFAKTSVACVPTTARGAGSPAAIPELRQVVAATDLSEPGNRAIPFAYALLGAGGCVHLVHVTDTPGKEREIEDRLRSLVPDAAIARGIETHVHVVPDANAARAIAQSAERTGADLIVVASQGRTGLAKVVMGSVARSLLEITLRPVLVMRPPPE